MKLVAVALALVIGSLLVAQGQSQTKDRTQAKGILLEDLTWGVIPLGAAAKEHGPHLKLKNDWILAEYLKKLKVAIAAQNCSKEKAQYEIIRNVWLARRYFSGIAYLL